MATRPAGSVEVVDVALPAIGEQRVTRSNRVHTVVGLNKYSNTVYTVHVPTEGEPYMQHWDPISWISKTGEIGDQVTVEQMHDAFAKAGIKDGVL